MTITGMVTFDLKVNGVSLCELLINAKLLNERYINMVIIPRNHKGSIIIKSTRNYCLNNGEKILKILIGQYVTIKVSKRKKKNWRIKVYG